jgi:hypothetical protein
MASARANDRAKMMAMVFMGVLILTVGVIDEGAGICEGG